MKLSPILLFLYMVKVVALPAILVHNDGLKTTDAGVIITVIEAAVFAYIFIVTSLFLIEAKMKKKN